METPFSPATATWALSWPGRVARHDLVYLTPPQDPLQGLALGNGDVGALLWCEASQLILALNKCDLWDDGAGEDFANWAADQEEFSTTLRHAGRLIIDFGLPVFDPMYVADCRGRLRLADATAELQVAGPFGQVAVEAVVGHDDGLLRCQVRAALVEPVPLQVTLERFGSRTYSHWYSLVRRDPNLGLAGTEAAAGDEWVGITQQLSSGAFAVAAVLEPQGPVEITARRLHTRAAGFTVSPSAGTAASSGIDFAVWAGVTSPMPATSRAPLDAEPLTRPTPPGPTPRRRGTTPELGAAPDTERPADSRPAPLVAALTQVNARRRQDDSQWAAGHRQQWRSFWERSLMECGDDYLDNLWHLTMYYAAASQRGPYPGRFINGLWGFSRDVQNWNFYFHWNQQQTYWPLNAAGHHDLCDAYLRYRFDSLPLARADARRLFGLPGAFVSDVSERRGYNSRSEQHNYTPVMQVAADFWRQYGFTGDPEFLRQRALPYLLEAARFTAGLFEAGADGAYHARRGTAYEGWTPVSDCITVLACARTVMASVLEALAAAGQTDPDEAAWRHLLDHMTPLPVMRAGPALINRGVGQLVLRRGPFAGARAATPEILAVGHHPENGALLASRQAPKRPPLPAVDDLDTLVRKLDMGAPVAIADPYPTEHIDGFFPSSEYAAVFPCGPLGLAQAGSRHFIAAVNTVRLFAPAVMGWEPGTIVMARLGLGTELWASLMPFAERWQFYCNGWGHYGPDAGMRLGKMLRHAHCQVADATLPDEERSRSERRTGLWSWPFRHMGMESMSVLACALNESLLQSHDGTLRVAPATHPAQRARFTLHARGGFVVSAELADGVPVWVAVQSRRSGLCRLQNPWATAWWAPGSAVAGTAGPLAAPPLASETEPAQRGRARSTSARSRQTASPAARPLAETAAAWPASSSERTLAVAMARGDVMIFAPSAATLNDWHAVACELAANSSPRVSPNGLAQLGLPSRH